VAETVSERLRQFVTDRANGRCEYCQSPQAYATERFSIEHIQPRVTGGLTVAENLALACQGCNGHKAARTTGFDSDSQQSVPLFHPRLQIWPEHFAWSEDLSLVAGLTPAGNATIAALHMNRGSLQHLRRALIAVKARPSLAQIFKERWR
jgi:HNH endonuclease